MKPLLYDKTGNVKLGELTNCIECLVEEERNGLFEVSLIYPTNDTLFNSLEEENIIVCNANDTLLNQKFRIYMTRKLMSNKIEVFARHISFDLAYDYVNNIEIEKQSCEYALNTIFRSSQFSTHYKGYSDIINAQDYKISNVNCIEAIGGKEGSVLDTFGTSAEILRDNTNIHVLNKRGHDNGVSIEYAKNLTGFELEEDYSELITRIIPFASYTDDETNEEILVEANAVDSDYISNYSHPYISYMDFSGKFEDKEIPTTSKLIELAKKYFKENECDKPKQNFKIEFIPLSKCVGYEGIQDNISLCDTVTIKDTRFNVNTKAKVIKTIFNVLKNRYESMELGEPRTTLGDIISSNAGGEDGKQGPPGPQGPPGQDGSIGDFPNSLPSTPVLSANVYGFASIELNWTYENKVYYNYELYGSKTKDFTPNTFDLIHAGQTSSYLFQAKPNETWHFRVCAVNTHGERTPFSDQVTVNTTKIDDMSNYFEEAAIGNAVIGTLSSDYMEAGIIKGHYIDAKNLSVTDGNGKRTLDIDSFGNVNLNVTSLKVSSSSIATEDYVKDQINNSQVVSIVSVETWFYLSDSPIELIGGEWSTTSPSNVIEGKFVWTKTITYFSDNSSTETTAFCITAMGSDGVGIVDVYNYYMATDWSEGVYVGMPGWSTEIQTTDPVNKYLWNCEEIIYSNGTSTITTPCIIGTYGDEGRGIARVIEYYMATDWSEGVYIGMPGWSTEIQTIDEFNRFLWNVEQIEYTDGTYSMTEPIIIGVYGQNGSNGVGIEYLCALYYLSTSKTELVDGWWSDVCPQWESGKYLWICYYICYTDGTETATEPFVDSSWEKVNDLEGSVNDVISRVTKAEHKITDDAIISTVTSSTTYKDALTGKVDTNKVISSINQTSESIKIQANKIQLEGSVTVANKNGDSVKINNGDYEIRSGSTVKGFLGLRNLDDSYTIPRLALGQDGLLSSSNNYFVIQAYPKNNNPQNYEYPYVDIAYRLQKYKTSENVGDVSNIKMYGDGVTRLSPVKTLEITTNFKNGSYNGEGENLIAEFGSSSSSYYDKYMDIPAIRNTQTTNGLILAHRNANDQSCFVRVNCDSNGDRFFRPLTTDGNISLGSGNYQWKSVHSKTTYSSAGVIANDIEVMPVNNNDILDNINFISTLNDEEELIIDVTNIKNTNYVDSYENNVYLNNNEIIKLLLKEVKQLKEEIKVLKGGA